ATIIYNDIADTVLYDMSYRTFGFEQYYNNTNYMNLSLLSNIMNSLEIALIGKYDESFRMYDSVNNYYYADTGDASVGIPYFDAVISSEANAGEFIADIEGGVKAKWVIVNYDYYKNSGRTPLVIT
ncbi:unnamed protein product, partial [marine sediment metagenome]